MYVSVCMYAKFKRDAVFLYFTRKRIQNIILLLSNMLFENSVMKEKSTFT